MAAERITWIREYITRLDPLSTSPASATRDLVGRSQTVHAERHEPLRAFPPVGLLSAPGFGAASTADAASVEGIRCYECPMGSMKGLLDHDWTPIGKSICADCLTSPALKSVAEDHLTEGSCDYCERTADMPIAASTDVLMEHIDDSLKTEWTTQRTCSLTRPPKAATRATGSTRGT
jgi:hypothetical protein